MKKHRTLALLLALGQTQFYSPAAARGASNAPGNYEDWHDLDHVQIMQTFALANYKAIVVAPVST